LWESATQKPVLSRPAATEAAVFEGRNGEHCLLRKAMLYDSNLLKQKPAGVPQHPIRNPF
jgi:hypothetical protein